MFFLYVWLSSFIYFSNDPMVSVLSFIGLIGLVVSSLSVWVPFWATYLLFLLVLSGILVVLVLISTITKPILMVNDALGFSVIFCFYWFISRETFHIPLWGFFSSYGLVYYVLIGFLLFLFLVSCCLFLYRNSALRLL